MALLDATPCSVSPEPEKPRSFWATVLRYSWIAVLIAAVYVAWVLYGRHEREQAAEAELQKQKQQQERRVDNLIFGNGQVQITQFSADNGILKKGDNTELCYGVVNAASVQLDPPVEQAKPTYHHCVEVAPQKTTTYTLTAKGAKGNSKTSSLTVQVN